MTWEPIEHDPDTPEGAATVRLETLEPLFPTPTDDIATRKVEHDFLVKHQRH